LVKVDELAELGPAPPVFDVPDLLFEAAAYANLAGYS
jgi:hypothetical protein